jgi:acetyl esterase/lipase
MGLAAWSGKIAWVVLLLSSIGLFLSLWIGWAAPTFNLLPLSVGTPEMSPFLVLGNAIALILALIHRSLLPGRIALATSITALVLSSWPLSQLPNTIRQANRDLVEQFGDRFGLPAHPAMRPRPFSFKATFTGIPTSPEVRHTAAVPFAQPAGVPLTLEIYRPPQDPQPLATPSPSKNPTVLTIYGGAWQRGTPTENAAFNRYLAAQGYTAIALDYRHAPAHRFPAQLEDIHAALTFIQAHADEYEVDLNRIAVIGRSAGAQLALLLAYRQPAPPLRGVVNFYGPVDLATAYRHPPQPDPINTRSVLDAFIGGSPDIFPEPYRAASPIYYPRPGLPPTLTLQGQRDHIVEAKYAWQLTNRLRAEGNAAVLIELPWADHAFDAVFNGLSNQLALYYVERFLATILRGNIR